MKITKEHYEKLEMAIKNKHNDTLANHTHNYSQYLRFGHTNKRIAWDLVHASGMTPFVCDTLYKYLNDTHIETAIVDIWKKISNRL
jgi:hypothetical protein